MQLLDQLVSSLGVTQEQAEGGTGLLMQLARDHLPGADFQKVLGAEPGLESLLDKAPGGGLLGKAGGLLGSFGADKAGGLAQLAGAASQLGLQKDVLMQFVPQILGYFQGQGKGDIVELLKKALPI